MQTTEKNFEVHDASVLKWARELIDSSPTTRVAGEEVVHAVRRNEIWRGGECLNLLAPEAPTSPLVRKLLSSEVGIRAAEGHIGPKKRWFAGTQYIDEIESLCMELLKKAFNTNYADHRLIASMLGNMTVYASLTDPGDPIMSISQPFGGHSSNRMDGPAGIRGLHITDIPMDPVELTVDLDHFSETARKVRPKVVTLGASMTLFPFPIKEMADILSEWDGKIFFDGAHQLGLIGAGLFQDPLKEGASVLTGSAGKTFSGPQSGIILWDDPALTEPFTDTIFPALAATHQVNRVAALAVAAAEFLEYGEQYMHQIVKNAKALGEAFQEEGIPVVGAHKNFTETHQIILDVSSYGGGYPVANHLAEANIITNKNLIPTDKAEDWDEPSGLRIGTTEITRLGMKEVEMKAIAKTVALFLKGNTSLTEAKRQVQEMRSEFQTLHYCFEE